MACAYLHNARRRELSALHRGEFTELLAPPEFRPFAGDQLPGVKSFLLERVWGLDEIPIMEKVGSTAFRPHKRLFDHVALVIRKRPRIHLCSTSGLSLYNAIVDGVRARARTRSRSSSWSRGVPGPVSQ